MIDREELDGVLGKLKARKLREEEAASKAETLMLEMEARRRKVEVKFQDMQMVFRAAIRDLNDYTRGQGFEFQEPSIIAGPQNGGIGKFSTSFAGIGDKSKRSTTLTLTFSNTPEARVLWIIVNSVSRAQNAKGRVEIDDLSRDAIDTLLLQAMKEHEKE